MAKTKKKATKPVSKNKMVSKAAKSKPKKAAKPVKKAKVKPTKKVSKPIKKAVTQKKKVEKKKIAVKPVKAEKPAKPVKVEKAPKKEKMQAPVAEVKQPEKFVLPPLPPKPVTTYTPMKQMPDVKMVPKSSNPSDKVRYSDVELKEFKALIIAKLEEAKAELSNLNAALVNANDNGTDDTASTFKMLEDGSETLAKEEAGQLAVRQRKFVEQLENALTRIDNKTYGICRVTGKLIPKERLRAVPHTTQSIEAKMHQYRD